MVETMGVRQALETFMGIGEGWGCRLVAVAHPMEAFEPIGDKMPALWLSSRERFPRFSESMLALLDPHRRMVAIESASAHLCKAALGQIHVCMTFQAVLPAGAHARRLRKEAKLAKAVSRLIRAASAPGGRHGPAEPEIAAQAAMRGLARGIDSFIADNPVCSLWVRTLSWHELAALALARAEAKMIKADAVSPAQADGASPSKARRL